MALAAGLPVLGGIFGSSNLAAEAGGEGERRIETG